MDSPLGVFDCEFVVGDKFSRANRRRFNGDSVYNNLSSAHSTCAYCTITS